MVELLPDCDCPLGCSLRAPGFDKQDGRQSWLAPCLPVLPLEGLGKLGAADDDEDDDDLNPAVGNDGDNDDEDNDDENDENDLCQIEGNCFNVDDQ